jgi:hypothetical protein
MPETFVNDFTEHAEEDWITDNGARMVARAWTDPPFRERMLADGSCGKEMGFEFPEHHRQLVVLENTANVEIAPATAERASAAPLPVFSDDVRGKAVQLTLF